MNKPFRLNDAERELWVRNDQELHLMWIGAKCSMREFLRTQRNDVDAYILASVGKEGI